MSYYGNGVLGCDAGVMITASHNPGPYNGFKLARAQAVPISGATGIADIERIVASGAFAPPAAVRGTVTRHDIAAEYAAFVRQSAAIRRPLRIAADFANAMGIWESAAFEGLPLEITRLYGDPDGRFPNHEANPLETHTLDDDWTVVTDDGGMAAHWEHSVAVHTSGLWVLTAEDGGAARLAEHGIVPVRPE